MTSQRFHALLAAAPAGMISTEFDRWYLGQTRNDAEGHDEWAMYEMWLAYERRDATPSDFASYELDTDGQEVLDPRGNPVMRRTNGSEVDYRVAVLGADYD